MYYTTINNKKYAFDFTKLKELCIISGGEETKEKEITEVNEINDDDELEMTSKVVREIKYPGNSQNDAIMFDMIKMFITRIINNETTITDEMDFATSLCFNSFLNSGALIEINDK